MTSYPDFTTPNADEASAAVYEFLEGLKVRDTEKHQFLYGEDIKH